jgi:hypothetical protein
MPEISRFLGIVVYMYYKDHAPPHFHAEYGEYTVTVDIDSGIVQGKFPRRAMGVLLEWYVAHQAELNENWALAEQQLPLNRIEPLE